MIINRTYSVKLLIGRFYCHQNIELLKHLKICRQLFETQTHCIGQLTCNDERNTSVSISFVLSHTSNSFGAVFWKVHTLIIEVRKVHKQNSVTYQVRYVNAKRWSRAIVSTKNVEFDNEKTEITTFNLSYILACTRQSVSIQQSIFVNIKEKIKT